MNPITNNKTEELTEELEEEIIGLKKEAEEKDQKLKELERKLEDIESRFDKHQHTGKDFSLPIEGDIELDDLGAFVVGNTTYTSVTSDRNTANEREILFLLSGTEKGKGLRESSKNSQLNLEHQEVLKETFFYGYRPPLYIGRGINIESGGSTLSHTKWNWETNELAGTYIIVWDSNEAFKQCKVISSNTANTITITGTWNFTDSDSTYMTFKPIYWGSAQLPFKRLYTTQDESGGIRFGLGPTGGGATGMLYMKSSDGNLYFRDMAGAETKVN